MTDDNAELVRQWRKKPVVIEAVRWNGMNLREIIDFIGLHPSADKWTWAEYEAVVEKDGLKIFTLEGSHMAAVGDYIIKGVHGEFYPCKPDIFAKTYEADDNAELVLSICDMLLEDVAKDPARLVRAQEIAKRDIPAALSRPAEEKPK